MASHDSRRESSTCKAEIAQLGERQTEDLKVPGSRVSAFLMQFKSYCGINFVVLNVKR